MKKLLRGAAALLGTAAAAGTALHFINKKLHKDICMIAHRGTARSTRAILRLRSSAPCRMAPAALKPMSGSRQTVCLW